MSGFPPFPDPNAVPGLGQPRRLSKRELRRWVEATERRVRRAAKGPDFRKPSSWLFAALLLAISGTLQLLRTRVREEPYPVAVPRSEVVFFSDPLEVDGFVRPGAVARRVLGWTFCSHYHLRRPWPGYQWRLREEIFALVNADELSHQTGAAAKQTWDDEIESVLITGNQVVVLYEGKDLEHWGLLVDGGALRENRGLTCFDVRKSELAGRVSSIQVFLNRQHFDDYLYACDRGFSTLPCPLLDPRGVTMSHP